MSDNLHADLAEVIDGNLRAVYATTLGEVGITLDRWVLVPEVIHLGEGARSVMPIFMPGLPFHDVIGFLRAALVEVEAAYAQAKVPS